MRANITIAVVCLVASQLSQAQGTVNFANLGVGLNAPVYIDGLSGTKAAAGYMAQLLLDTGGSLTAVGSPANFIGAAAPGYYNGGVVTVSQVAPGAMATFRVFSWDSITGASTYPQALAAWNGGLIHAGYSGPATIVTGGVGVPPSLPATLVGLGPWSMLVPEPSAVLLGLLGASAMLLLRRRR